MNIILITPKLNIPALYHTDIIDTLCKLYNVYQYGPGFDYYSSSDSIQDIIAKSGFSPHLIVFGTASVLYSLRIRNLESICIPKLIFLNKEYQHLSRKLAYIKYNQFDLVSTILNKNSFEPWEKLTGIPFVQTPHGIFPDKFPNLSAEKVYDIGFLGALFSRYGVSTRRKAKSYIFNETDISKNHKILWIDDETDKSFLAGEEYVRALNSCKIFLSTLSPSRIIGLRFYELACTKTLIFAPKDYYDGVFVDGVNCVMYKDNPKDFKERFLYYIGHPEERNRIASNAYDYVTTHCTWDTRIKGLIQNYE